MRILTVLLAVTAALPVAWTAPVAAAWLPAFDAGPSNGFDSALAAAPDGTLAVLWFQPTPCPAGSCAALRARLRDPAGNWGATETITSQNGIFPQVVSRPDGGFTAVWAYGTSNLGLNIELFTADRIGGAWTAPKMISQYIGSAALGTNAAGEQVVAWSEGVVPSQGGSTGVRVRAATRPAGGAWTTSIVAAKPPTGANNVRVDHAAATGNGDALVSWESFDNRCDPKGYCFQLQYNLHAARAANSGTHWADASSLGTANDFSGHGGVVLTDAGSNAAVIDSQYSERTKQYSTHSFAQRQAGAPWLRSAAISGPVPNPASNITVEVGGADAAGHATLAFVTQAKPAAPLHVGVLDGDIVSNTWGAPRDLQLDNFSQVRFALAVAANGKAVLAWSSVTPTFVNYSTVRRATGANWRAPVPTDAVPGFTFQEYGPASTAVAAGGSAAVSYPGATLRSNGYNFSTLVKVNR